MQTAKPAGLFFRYETYDIDVEVISQRKLALTVVDSVARYQFYERELVLENIGSNTLIKAFDRSKKQIKVSFAQKNIAENILLQITVSIESPFLKPVQQVILMKKVRDVSETETVKKAIDHLGKRIKELKESKDKNKLTTYFGGELEQKFYNNASTYQPVASVKLLKGKYLITFNFLLKAQNQWFYLYFGQGQQVMTNSGFYVPTTGHFMPHTVRKIHTVTQDQQVVSFTTYCANSYPVTIKNCIITAKPIPE